MKNKGQVLLVLFAIGLIFSGCSKYDENKGISLKSKTKRISQIWKIDNFVLANGTTIQPGAEEGYVEFKDNGKVISHYVDGSTVEGNWGFINKKKQISWSNEYITDIEQVVIFDDSYILKLTNEEFWLKEQSGGITTKFSVK